MHHRFATVLLLAALAAASFATSSPAETARVLVLHTTDVHASLAAWDDLADRPANRGLVKIARLVADARREAPTLLLDAGDATSGSPIASVWRMGDRSRPEPVTAVMNAMGYDAMALGNHEFDPGPTLLERTRAASRFPWLAANVARVDGSAGFPASIVRTLGGVRIGVVGVCTPAVSRMADAAWWAPWKFDSPVDAAKREVERLRTVEKCDAIVLLAHTGLESDPRTGEMRKGDAEDENWGGRLARGVPGVDLLILGHTHASVPYANVGPVLVTQAGSRAEALGKVELTFTRDAAGQPWKLDKRFATLQAVTDTTPSDPEIESLVRPYAEATRTALAERVATAAGPIAAPRGRFADSNLWRLIHQVQLDVTKADVSLAALFDPSVRIAAGPITRRDLLRIYPYDNSLDMVEMTGAALKQALEQSARGLAAYTYEDGRPLTEPGWPAWNFDMAAGVRYEVDLTRPAGDRIVNLTWQGKALDPAQVLTVAVNGYRANGGGAFASVAKAKKLWTSTNTMPEILEAWARSRGTIDLDDTAEWSLLPDYAPTPERPLIDRLVRLGAIPRGDVRRMIPDAPARRVDLAYGLGRAFGWRSKRFSDAYADVPDSAEAWVDGVLRAGVLTGVTSGDKFQPFLPVSLANALDWSERAARKSRYALAPGLSDPSFRRSLVTGVSIPRTAKGFAFPDTITRAQWLGILCNLRYPSVRVLETTDFHGAILGGSRERRSGRPIGSSPALAAAIERLRAENPEGTVLVDGGDIYQGTMISNLQYGRPVVEQMNALGYVALSVGNHEFDWTADTLKQRILEMKFPALAANMIERKSGKRPWWVRADTTVLRRGAAVGVFGIAYPGTPRVTLPAYVAHLRFEDDSLWGTRLAPQLRKKGAAVVVGLGHLPAETDSTRKARGDLARLARDVKGVDVWFGGHSHNVVDDRVGGTPAIISGSHGQWVGQCDLVVDPVARRVLERETRMNQVWADVPVDSAWTSRVTRWNANVAPIAAQVLGRIDHALSRTRPEAPIGNFIADAMRLASGADIALQNPGGMRGDLPAGTITRGGVYEIMPFDNTIVTMELTGAEVRKALEQALRGDRVTQVSGLRYVIDTDRPAMSRVVSITNPDGTPFDEAKTYKVAANNFMASGGDSYDALAGGRDKVDTGLVIRGAMEAFVREKCAGGASLPVNVDGRIKRAGQ